MIKNSNIKEIHQVQQNICIEQVSMLKICCFYIILHLNLKRLGFTGETVTQWTHQIPCERDSRERICCDVTTCHAMSNHIMIHVATLMQTLETNAITVRCP